LITDAPKKIQTLSLGIDIKSESSSRVVAPSSKLICMTKQMGG